MKISKMHRARKLRPAITLDEYDYTIRRPEKPAPIAPTGWRVVEVERQAFGRTYFAKCVPLMRPVLGKTGEVESAVPMPGAKIVVSHDDGREVTLICFWGKDRYAWAQDANEKYIGVISSIGAPTFDACSFSITWGTKIAPGKLRTIVRAGMSFDVPDHDKAKRVPDRESGFTLRGYAQRLEGLFGRDVALEVLELFDDKWGNA